MLKKETLNLLKDNKIRLNRRKGQNYLIDENILKKIMNFTGLTKNDTVLEVGAGIGTLTIPLSHKSGKVIAIEHDNKISSILEKRLEDMDISNVSIINGDAVHIDFPEFNKVVSNLPYKISSPFTFKLLK